MNGNRSGIWLSYYHFELLSKLTIVRDYVPLIGESVYLDATYSPMFTSSTQSIGWVQR